MVESIQLDRYMVNLFFEIKRNAPHDCQQDMLVSDPNLGKNLSVLYQKVSDENLKLLIEVFFERAGPKWLALIKPKKTAQLLQKINSKAKIADKSSAEQKENSDNSGQPKARYYRGVRID